MYLWSSSLSESESLSLSLSEESESESDSESDSESESESEGPTYVDGYWDGYDKASRDYIAARDNPAKPSPNPDKPKDKPKDDKQTDQKNSVNCISTRYYNTDDSSEDERQIVNYDPESKQRYIYH